jgi:hypothetical protein
VLDHLNRRLFLAASVAAAALSIGGAALLNAAPAGASTGTTVAWTGLGSDNLTNGGCTNPTKPADDLTPPPGDEGWLFILNSVSPTSGWTVTATFSGGLTVSTGVTQVQSQNDHFALYTPLGATLVSATATNTGSATFGNFTLSHCGGASLADMPTLSTSIFDSHGNAVTSVQADSVVHDTGTLFNTFGFNGTPQGSVAFTWYTNGTCSGTGTSAGSATVDANGFANGSDSEGPLAPGDYSFSATYTSSNAGLWNGAVSPCEPLHVSPPPSAPLTGGATGTPSFARAFTWQIAKSADHSEVDVPNGTNATVNYSVTVTKSAPIDSGWQVAGTISVRNPNSLAVTAVNVTDAIDANATCTVTGGSGVTLPRASTTSFPYTCTYSAAPGATSQTDTATITWGDQTLLSGYVWLHASSATATAGVSWSTPTTVTGDSISVSDSIAGTLGTTSSSKTYNYPESFAGRAGSCTTYPNTARIVDTGATASASVKVCVGSDLNVSATGKPSFTRTYAWGIHKSVDSSRLNIPAGGTATSHYSVAVTHDGGTDSAWQVAGTITVSNPNGWESVPLTGVTDSIDNGGSCSITSGNPHATVAAGGSVTLGYTCSYSSAPSPAAYTDTASATWSASAAATPDGSASGTAAGSFGAPTTIVDGSASVSDSVEGALGTVSYTDASPKTFTYSIDRHGAAGTCKDYPNTASFLTSDTSSTGSDSASVKVCVGSDLNVAATGKPSFTRTYSWGIHKSVDSGHVSIPAGGTATSHYAVAVSHDSGTDSGWTVTGKVTVSNPNDWEAINVSSVKATVDDGGTCSVTGGDTPGSVPAGGSITLDYSCSYSSAPSPAAFTVTGTANWDGNAANTPDGTASGTAAGAFGDPTTIVDGSVSVSDSVEGALGTVSYTDSSPKTFTYSIDRHGHAGTCTDYPNKASFVTSDTSSGGSDTADVTVCVGSDLNIAATGSPSFTRTYAWGIHKSVDSSRLNIPAGGTATSHYAVAVSHDSGTDSGWQVAGAITVSNPNDWEAIPLTGVTDSIDNGGSCSITGGDPNGTVPAGGSVTLHYLCTYANAPSPAAFTDTAKASWDGNAANTPDGSASGTASGAFGDPTTIVDGSVSVSDSVEGSLGTVSYTDASPTTFPYSVDRHGHAGTCTDYPNTASFITSDTSTTGSDNADVTVCVGSDLNVAATGKPSYTRTFAWSIHKSVDSSRLDIPAGGTATSNYAVSVSHDGGTDSAWQVAGTITVSNPNDWEAIPLTGVTDAIDNGGSCTITSGDPHGTIPAGGSATLGYTCSYSSAPSPAAFTDTATANWDGNAANTPDGSASGTASGAFGDPTTIVDGSVVAYDSVEGGLGPVRYTDASPTTFVYGIDRHGVAGTCTDYPNTASFITSDTSTTGSDSASVKVCVGSDLNVSPTGKPDFTRTYGWGIHKSVDSSRVNIAAGGTATSHYAVSVTHDSGTDSGWTVTGKVTVSNPNDWESIPVSSVTAAIDDGGTCSVANGDTPGTVAAGGSITLDYTCHYTSAPSPAAFTVTGTANWDGNAANTPDGTASGTAAGAFGDPTTIVDGSVSVSDSVEGALGTVSYTDSSPKTFTYSIDRHGHAGTCTDYPNKASFVTSDTSSGGSDTADVTVCVGSDLNIAATGSPSFTRTYAWGIHKSVDSSRLNIPAGGTATSHYAVAVSHDSGTDSGWQVAGAITVSNPNDWEAIPLTGVTDSIDNGGSCSITGGDPNGTVPAGGSVTLHYLCTYANAPSPAAFTDTAKASWDGNAANTPDGSASGTASGAFGDPTTIVDGSVSVSDSVEGSLGTVSYTDASPTTFPYSIDRHGVAGTCKDYPNTASFITSDTSTTGSDSASVRVCVGSDLNIAATGSPSFTRTYAWGIHKSVDSSHVNIAAGGKATSKYTVNVTHDSGTDSAWQVAGTITVSNPNDWESIPLTGVTDSIDNGGSCSITSGDPNGTVPASGSVALHYLCTYSSAPSPAAFTDTATANWDGNAANTPDGSASGTASGSFGAPTKIVDGSVSVTDSAEGPLGSVSYTDASPTSFTYSIDRHGVAGTCKDYPNTASFLTSDTSTGGSDSADVTVCVGSDLSVSATASPSFARSYAWGIHKSVDASKLTVPNGTTATSHYTVAVTHDSGTDSGWKVTGKVTVSNPNDWEAIPVSSVTAAIDNGGTCSVTGGNAPGSVPAGGSVTLNYTCTYSSAPTANAFNVTGTAHWDGTGANTPDGSANGTASGAFANPTTIVDGSVSVSDSVEGSLGTVFYTAPSPKTFTYSIDRHGVAGTCTTYPNTASFVTSDTSSTGSSSASVTVCVASDLGVAKTASTSYSRVYQWAITKSVDKSLVEQSGGSVTANYTVVAKETGFADGNWKVAGTITVSNPNDFESVTASVADSLPGCTLDHTSVTVPASGSASVGYTCPVASGASGTNGATASWSASGASTPDGSASTSTPYSFAASTSSTTNAKVTVTDTFNGGSPTTLGTLTATDAAPYATATYTYSRTVPVTGSVCVVFPNTASVAGQTASASFTVCGTNTGGLTMGYWQNKNGQALVSGANQTALLAYLKSYAPFADATAPLTTYTTNVIKAASAAGAAMNPMLKGQMLATALSVYFSDPALGGNLTGATGPLGNVKIDLTHVSPDGNVSAAFGGATALTVKQILSYAASQSNAGGSTWYGQNKATQQLAKDTFDLINNANALLAP